MNAGLSSLACVSPARTSVSVACSAATILFKLDFGMDNKAIAGILYETADLLEIDGADSFRIRSYRNAARGDRSPAPANLRPDRRTQAGPGDSGIGKGMLTNLQEMFREGRLAVACRPIEEVSAFDARVAEDARFGAEDHRTASGALLRFLTSRARKLAREGKIRELPRMGEKQEQKLLEVD